MRVIRLAAIVAFVVALPAILNAQSRASNSGCYVGARNSFMTNYDLIDKVGDAMSESSSRKEAWEWNPDGSIQVDVDFKYGFSSKEIKLDSGSSNWGVVGGCALGERTGIEFSLSR